MDYSTNLHKIKCLVIGMGSFGTALSRELFDEGFEVTAVDLNRAALEANNAFLAEYYVLDCTQKPELQTISFQQFEAVFVCIGAPESARLLTALLLKDLDVTNIYVRYDSALQERALRSCGISTIKEPERKTLSQLFNSPAAKSTKYPSAKTARV